MIRNIDNCEYSEKHGVYGGVSSLKDGVVIDGKNWLVKYPKNAKDLRRHEEMEYTNDAVSEFLGSHIYSELNIPVHETMLVERRGKIAVACRDFEEESKKLIEIRTIKNAANDELEEKLNQSFSSTGSTHCVNLEEIMLHLKYNDILKNIQGINERFWNMMVVDIFLNNNDRNNGNWGILREKGKQDTLAPVFDNGGAFNGKTPDSRLKRMLDNEQVLLGSIMGSNTTFSDAEGNIILAREMLQKDFTGLSEAVIKIVPKIHEKMDSIIDIIRNIPDEACSKIRKDFYCESIKIRYQKLLFPALERVRCSDLSDKMSLIDVKSD